RPWPRVLRQLVRRLPRLRQLLLRLLPQPVGIGARLLLLPPRARRADHRGAEIERHRAPRGNLPRARSDGGAGSAVRTAVPRAAVRADQAARARRAHVARPAAGALSRSVDRRVSVHAALLSVALLFSANYIISKLAMRALRPLVFAWLRMLGAAIVLNVIIRERAPAPLTQRDRWAMVGFAALGIVCNQTFFLAGLALTDAHIAAILITMLPVFVLGVSIALGRERASAARIGGVAPAAAGAPGLLGGWGVPGAMESPCR